MNFKGLIKISQNFELQWLKLIEVMDLGTLFKIQGFAKFEQLHLVKLCCKWWWFEHNVAGEICHGVTIMGGFKQPEHRNEGLRV